MQFEVFVLIGASSWSEIAGEHDGEDVVVVIFKSSESELIAADSIVLFALIEGISGDIICKPREGLCGGRKQCKN